MSEVFTTSIVDHAVSRYRERIGPLPENPAAARILMFGEIMQAKVGRLRKAFVRRARTAYIPTERAIFIASRGYVVTVIPRNKDW